MEAIPTPQEPDTQSAAFARFFTAAVELLCVISNLPLNEETTAKLLVGPHPAVSTALRWAMSYAQEHPYNQDEVQEALFDFLETYAAILEGGSKK